MMLETAIQSTGVHIVTGLRSVPNGLAVAMDGDLSATLPSGHPDWNLLQQRCEESLHSHVPVGVLVDAHGCFIDLNYAHSVRVHQVRQDEDDTQRWQVAVWGFSSICYLTRDHPEFERVRTTLTEAATSGQQVWLANCSWPVEGDTEIWLKIMDVRPVADQPLGE